MKITLPNAFRMTSARGRTPVQPQLSHQGCAAHRAIGVTMSCQSLGQKLPLRLVVRGPGPSAVIRQVRRVTTLAPYRYFVASSGVEGPANETLLIEWPKGEVKPTNIGSQPLTPTCR